jgi:C-terminal processing protease CtpA/Prc
MRGDYMFETRELSATSGHELVIDRFAVVSRKGPPLPAITGIGAINRDGKLQVSRVAADSPARAAGIVVGDQLVSVDGNAVGDVGQQGISQFLDGALDTDVKIDLVRANGAPYTVTLRRQKRTPRPAPF